jgi:hypothetical protein
MGCQAGARQGPDRVPDGGRMGCQTGCPTGGHTGCHTGAGRGARRGPDEAKRGGGRKDYLLLKEKMTYSIYLSYKSSSVSDVSDTG